MMMAFLLTINSQSDALAHAQANFVTTRTLTATAPMVDISRPFSVDIQQQTIQYDFAPLILSAGDNPNRVFISTPFTVSLTRVAPVLDVGLIVHVAQTTYDENAVDVALRGSVDGETWTDWQIIDHFHVDAVGLYAHLFSFDQSTRYIQLGIFWDETAISQSITFSSATISLISAGETPPSAIADIQARASSGQTIMLPNSAPQPVVSRTGWGCPDGQNAPLWSPQYTTITHFIVHHTATPNTDTDWAARVRSIWHYHTNTLGWGDIGYNYLIDPNGVIYEGRAGGDGSIGAHFSCMNSKTMGIALIGTFTSVNPSNNALNSLKNLLAWKATILNINPTGWGYHNPSALTMWNISGHRDGNSSIYGCPSGTTCPGDVLYHLLPSIRNDVANLIVPTLTPTPTSTNTPTPTRTPTPTITPTPSNTPTNYTEWDIPHNDLLHQLQIQNHHPIGYVLVVYGERQLEFYVDVDGVVYIITIAIRRTIVDFVEMTVLSVTTVDHIPADEGTHQYLAGIIPADFIRALDALLDNRYGVSEYNVEDVLIGNNRLRVGVLLGG